MPSPNRIVAFLHPNLGDAVHHSITTRWIHEAWPSARLVVVTGKLGEAILGGCPWIDDVWCSSGNKYGLFPRILREKFDLALFPYVQNSFLRMAIAARIPARVGIRGGKYDRFLTRSTHVEPTENVIGDAVEALLGLLGKPAGSGDAYIACSAAADREADRLFGRRNGQTVALMVGAGNMHKLWPRDRFVGLAERFLDEGYGVVSVGGSSEKGSFEGLPGVLDLAGRCSVLGTAEILRRCALVVANDTGVAHLAAAVNTPTVVIYGPSRVLLPPGGPSVILRRTCDCAAYELGQCDGACLRGHSVDEVFRAATALL